MLGGLPENSQLLHSELIMPEALETPPDKNCAIYQISKLLKCEYATLEDTFRVLFQELYHAEMTYCTPLMIIQYAMDQGHSVYYLTSNTLVYKNVIDGHKQALAFQSFDGHAYFYRSAIPFAGMPAQCVKITDAACLPFRGSPKNTPLYSEMKYWPGEAMPGYYVHNDLEEARENCTRWDSYGKYKATTKQI